MSRNLNFGLILFLLLMFSCSRHETILLNRSAESLKRFETLVVDIFPEQTSENVFDPNQLSVDCHIETPEGEKVVQPCFYMETTADGRDRWQLRFTPVLEGKYEYFVKISASEETWESHRYPLTVDVEDSSKDGFIRQGPEALENPTVFQFDTGRPFRGFGENVCWTDDYEYYFRKMHDTGMNFTRIWMCPWNLSLEWSETGLGRYNLENAERLDHILQLADQYDIYIMLCFEYHGVAQRDQGYFNENKWLENPYNSDNGGPCGDASEIFTHNDAIQFYKNRFRYIIARWGYSPNIHTWEFWNEVDLTAGSPEDIAAWHAEMAEYVREIDAHRHLLTTSFSSAEFREIWENPNFDLVQYHSYNSPDIAATCRYLADRSLREFQKKAVVGEFGVDFRGPSETMENDPGNIGLHNGLWAGYFSSAPILPLSWWWDNYIEPENLYPLFRALKQFDQVFFQQEISTVPDWQPLDMPAARLLEYNPNTDRNLVVYPSKGWSKNDRREFKILPSGLIRGKSEIPAFLYGHKKTDMRQPPEFIVQYPEDGFFTVKVKEISQYGQLRIYVDNELVLRQELPIGAGDGPWEHAEYRPEYKIWWGSYNREYSVEIPAGKHRIRVENDGLDWLSVEFYSFSHCRLPDTADLEISGFRSGQNRYLWLRNSRYFWKNVRDNGIPSAAGRSEVILDDFQPGDYLIEWIEPMTGALHGSENVNISHTRYPLQIPEIQTDLACRITLLNN